jgi:hypothetical protein
MIALSDHDERVLAVVSLAADRRAGRLERVARRVLDRDDAVTDQLRAAGANDDAAWRQIRDVCDRRRGNALDALELVVELVQQQQLRAGESRTWTWPSRRGGNDAPRSP